MAKQCRNCEGCPVMKRLEARHENPELIDRYVGIVVDDPTPELIEYAKNGHEIVFEGMEMGVANCKGFSYLRRKITGLIIGKTLSQDFIDFAFCNNPFFVDINNEQMYMSLTTGALNARNHETKE